MPNSPLRAELDKSLRSLDAGLSALSSPALDPVFYAPELLGTASAWWTHVPFAFWVTSACKPRLLVELGTHHGVSYAAFCEAVQRADLDTRCVAIDTWQGDDHAGHYGDQVYFKLKDFHDQRYSAFSTLMRSTFDEALPYFTDGSIDLLHIDGRHGYDDVRHDFEHWLPKLSKRAVVLFHDTNVRERDFGVARFFGEIACRYPTFEFLHGAGLGIAVVGEEAPEAVRALCEITEAKMIGALRSRFSHLGALWYVSSREQLGNEGKARERAEAETRLAHEFAGARTELEQSLRLTSSELERAQARAAKRDKVYDRAIKRIVDMRHTIETLSSALPALGQSSRLAMVDTARYASAFDDPATSVKARLRKRALMLLGPLGRKSLTGINLADTIRRSVYFDREWYLNAYPDVRRSGMDPALHYGLYGYKEGREPGPVFSGREYLANNADVAASGLNPLLHFISHGEAEGRSFKTSSDLALRKPLRFGRPEVSRGRAANQAWSLLYVSGEANTPGNIYRVLRYIEAARANGVDANWIDAASLTTNPPVVDPCDVLIIWRTPWSEAIANLIQETRSRGGKVVFDVDDLMTEPDLAKVELIDGIRSQALTEQGVREHYARVRQTMLAADLCFTATDELAFHLRWAKKTTHVLPNGFDQQTHDLSRLSAREWRKNKDNLIRLGYAGGSRTHQRDFGLLAEAVAKTLQDHPNCRLVLFRTPDGATPLIDVEEFPALKPVLGQIEWRPLQPLPELPREMARFDINLAPLEFGNAFCEAKSELKFFEAALVNVPTVASPTGPFRRAIDHGTTGFLAASAEDWHYYLDLLVRDPSLRASLAHAAYLKSLATFGPRQRALRMGRVIEQLHGGARAARGFALDACLSSRPYTAPKVYPSETVFESDKAKWADVSVVVPLYNYEKHIVEALDSVAAQTLPAIDLVIVDGNSTDNSLKVATLWAKKNAKRFNRIIVLKNQENYGLGPCRNSGFDAADTPYILLLDADNRLLPSCCENLLQSIKASAAAYVYPTIQHFGASSALISDAPYDPQRFVAGNYVDAMALVAKEAWALVGGFEHVRHGWEDYDFWCRLAEMGLGGEWRAETLAEYRVHTASMMKKQTTVPDNYRRLMANFEARHPWVSLIDRQTSRWKVEPSAEQSKTHQRLDDLLPILRCPASGQKLMYSEDRNSLISLDGTRKWPIVEGRPALAPELSQPEIRPFELISNEVPEAAMTIIRETKGRVLNLSAGGSATKFDHVVEVEYAIFRHTDVLADAHHLPFDDESFDAIISMNAFEHYREPHLVAAELFRVLKPGGQLHVRTAFLQPLHEKPWHFYNCTRYGMAEWFKAFEASKLDVSSNFCPNHSIAWLASECETALRSDVSPKSAEAFSQAKVQDIIDLWRDPTLRSSPLWTDFEKVSQDKQEITAAGFEFVGRKPDRKTEGNNNMNI